MDEGAGRGGAKRVALSVGLSVAAQYEDGVLALGELEGPRSFRTAIQ